jgi:hypothetical protein
MGFDVLPCASFDGLGLVLKNRDMVFNLSSEFRNVTELKPGNQSITVRLLTEDRSSNFSLQPKPHGTRSCCACSKPPVPASAKSRLSPSKPGWNCPYLPTGSAIPTLPTPAIGEQTWPSSVKPWAMPPSIPP